MERKVKFVMFVVILVTLYLSILLTLLFLPVSTPDKRATNYTTSQLPRFAVLTEITGGIERLSLVDQPKSLMQCQALAQAAKGECVVVVEEVSPDGTLVTKVSDETSHWIYFTFSPTH